MTEGSTMTDPATASAGAPDTMSMTTSDFMAPLNSFGSTMDTHGQALVLQQQTFAQHDHLLQQLLQASRSPSPILPSGHNPPDTGGQSYPADPLAPPQPVAPPPRAEPRQR